MHLPNLKEARRRRPNQVQHIYLNDHYPNVFVGQKFYLKTYGCQMNVHDSEAIKGYLNELGYEPTDCLKKADLIVLNTCAIRAKVQAKVLSFLGRYRCLKAEKPNLILALGGCLPQEEHIGELIKAHHPEIDIVFGTHNIHELPQLLLKKSDYPQIEVYSIEGNVYENMPYYRDSKITAWVNIMYGCDNFCTYCIVPFTRGKQRSRHLEDILTEIKNLKSQGYQEVTLLGQNVNAYGKDLTRGINFANLLEQVALTKIPRIRFLTSHPNDFTDEMIQVIARYSNIMPHFHLPLQSGSNRILKLMGRHYNQKDYLNLITLIKRVIPQATITTDLIVGFPNESETDFQATLDMVDRCQFDGAFTFIFSPRIGTPASLIKDKISLAVKRKRLALLNTKVNYYTKLSNQKYLGQIVTVLVLDSGKEKGWVYGYTENLKLVNIKAPAKVIGLLIKVKIKAILSFSLKGEMVQ